MQRKDQKEGLWGSLFLYLYFSLSSNVLKCKCTIFEMGNKCYIGEKG